MDLSHIDLYKVYSLSYSYNLTKINGELKYASNGGCIVIPPVYKYVTKVLSKCSDIDEGVVDF